MAITTRQTSLLVQQDWKTLYQTFREADFQSYDFETLRKSMIDYIRTYYPEDFNDFIESSEYIALIDLIAFLGQSLAFRTDINARENFIDTAERRDSILKLARLISYNPKRSITSTGFLKFDSVTTTENLSDSNGMNLSNLIISWNDSANDMWLEQFTTIIDAALVDSQVVGKPGNSQVLNGIQTDEYTVQLNASVTPTFAFTAPVNGALMSFEAVSATSSGESYVYEKPPAVTTKFNILYKNDNLGNSSANTGFFVYFKQGKLATQDFSLNDSLPNRVVSVNFDNINNSDVWLYPLDSLNRELTKWTQVPAVGGVNVIYNNIADRNLYQVSTRQNDQIDLVFGDGAFTNIPQGNFRLYYRTSNGQAYKITPDEMQGVTIGIKYQSRAGRTETLTVRASLHYTIANSTTKDTIEDIRSKAPQSYYTQNRMITGEDYNLFPYAQYSNILKIKSVNRTSSGVSRFLDVLDVTGKYSSTNVFAQDGWIYKEDFVGSFLFKWTNTAEIQNVVYNQIIPLLSAKELQHLYYSKYARYTQSGIQWTTTSAASTGSIGYFSTTGVIPLQVADKSSNNLQYVAQGAIVKFSAGAGKYFDAQVQIQTGTPKLQGDRLYIYAGIMDVNGTTITISQVVPDNSVLEEIIPAFKNNFTQTLITSIETNIRNYKSFGIRYDQNTQSWAIIEPQNVNLVNDPYNFDFGYAGDIAGLGRDTSWLIKFYYNGLDYTVNYRGINYVFESKVETRFYFDERVKVYDTKTGTTINDQIKVLKINTMPDSLDPLGQDQTWYVYKNIVENDGYQSNRRIRITFPDSNSDGVPDNPDLFEITVNPTVNPTYKYVYLQSLTDPNRFISTIPVDNATIISNYVDNLEITKNIKLYEAGQLFYATTERKFWQLAIDIEGIRTLNQRTDFIAYVGRQDLYFQYRHNSPNYRRIDPSPNNIMDLYILTKQYASDYTAWIVDTSGTQKEPSPPSNEELKTQYSDLENFKALSDTLIYNSAVFKPLFGTRADTSLQAKFKVVKNSNVVVSDNDIKASVVNAINNYFDINNWDFGESFYFSELSAYLHSTLTPNIASVVIVPNDSATRFGTLYQINAEANEILISAATVNDVEIISAITAAQLNQTLALTRISA